MFESPAELRELQDLLDSSWAGSSDHLKSIVRAGERTLTAEQVAEVCRGTYMRGEQVGIFTHGHVTPLNPRGRPEDPSWMVAYSVDPAALLSAAPDREQWVRWKAL